MASVLINLIFFINFDFYCNAKSNFLTHEKVHLVKFKHANVRHKFAHDWIQNVNQMLFPLMISLLFRLHPQHNIAN